VPFLGLGIFDEQNGMAAFADHNSIAGHKPCAFLPVAEDGCAVVDEDGGNQER
jgi:hypothetical protein